MSAIRDPDQILRAWLEEGPTDLPESTRQGIEVSTRTTPQRRHALRLPWRFNDMTTTFKLALGAAAVTAVVLGGAFFLGPPRPGVGGAPSPTPSPTASPTASPAPPTPSPNLLDTSTWTTYVSDRYGFSIDHPGDWTEDPADHDWTFENDIEAWNSTGTDSFYNPGQDADLGVRASAWSVTVAPGTTVGSWIEAYCTGQNAGPCTGILDSAVDVETGDQHPGLLSQFGDTMAYFLDGETMYVVAVWRSESDPSVRPYGGARRLLEAYISTLTFPAEPPQASPDASPSPS